MRLIRSALLVLAATLLMGCSGQSDLLINGPVEGVFSIDTVRFPSAIPFLEEVILPDVIYADELFTVRVRVSSELMPGLLFDDPNIDGDPRNRLLSSTGIFPPHGPQGTWIWLYMGLNSVPESGNVVDVLEIENSPLPAGEWVLGIETAESREWGGVECMFELGPSLGPINPQHVTTLYFPITVVERPVE